MKMLSIVTLFLLASTSIFASPQKKTLIADFELRWMNHPESTQTLWKSADFTDAVYVVEGYFDNCPYCNDNAPLVDQVTEEFSDKPQVKVLDVGRDCSEGEYRQWIARHSPNHPVLNDCNETVLGPLGISGYPTTVVLDCNLNPIWRNVGSMDANDFQNLKRTINEQLAKNCLRS